MDNAYLELIKQQQFMIKLAEDFISWQNEMAEKYNMSEQEIQDIIKEWLK